LQETKPLVYPFLTSSIDTDTDKWDYIMVFDIANKEAEGIKKKLQEASLRVMGEVSRDGDEVFFYITASDEELKKGIALHIIYWRLYWRSLVSL
jgi:hypothetical protein